MDASLHDLLDSHTVAEILALLPADQPVPYAAGRKRDRLLDYMESLPAETQAAIRAAADAAPGTKRRAVKQARNLNSISAMTQFVHDGDIAALVEGPFLRPVSEELIRDCIARTIDRTGNVALCQGRCMACARLQFVRDMRPCQPADIPNQALLIPTHPHPAQQFHDGMLLHPPALRASTTYLCEECFKKLSANQRPPLSLANNMWVGETPWILSILSLAERLLVALYFPAAYVVKSTAGMRGNVSTYRLNSNDIVDMVAGNLMPRPVGLLAAVLAVTFVGAHSASVMRFCGSKRITRFIRILISRSNVSALLPEGGIPEEISLNAHYASDASILDREHAGYVPMDLGDQEEVADSDSDLDPNEAEERDDFRPPHDPRVASSHEEDEEEWEDFDPAVIPLQAHGVVDVSGETVTNRELFVHAAGNLLAPAKRDYLVRRGGGLVNEYPRTRNGQPDGERFAGDPGDANHLLGAFPFLFPYGCGGMEVDRQSPVSYADHIKWALEYGDRRFRHDFHFMFMAFSALQRRQICYSACMQIKRSTFMANEGAFRRLKPADFYAAGQEEAQNKPISNAVVRALRQQLTTVRARVMGTDESRIGIRSQVWGMSLRHNPPSIWATLNLSDTGDPIAQTIKVILQELFGISANPRGAIDRRPGVLGTINGYIGTVEAQARGTLHLHILLWLQGAPTATMMRTALQSDEFRIKMQSFIRQNIRAHISGTTGADVLDIPLEKNIAYSRPEDPRKPDYAARATAAERRIARAVQPHDLLGMDRLFGSYVWYQWEGFTQTSAPLSVDEHGQFVLKDQLKQYQDRGHALDDMSFYDFFRLTYDGEMLEERAVTNTPARGRPRSVRVPYLPEANRSGCRVIRGEQHETNLHFIGRWFPRANDPIVAEYYSAQMLLLLSPWCSLCDLKGNHLSFQAALTAFKSQATAHHLRILDNIQYFYQLPRMVQMQAWKLTFPSLLMKTFNKLVGTATQPESTFLALSRRRSAKIVASLIMMSIWQTAELIRQVRADHGRGGHERASEVDMVKYAEWGAAIAAWDRSTGSLTRNVAATPDLGAVVAPGSGSGSGF
ncbi:ATP-dependent DNA helicase [Mycena chlorophos]|uniref:ATP-dependent DNA helicase n=1 Tax=Mycena chlorophos TaxID=658473 RepID=A0A8H6VWB0_MYCCL|nr:ATP-dependent DNA helicase [Mycena chlorophos]